MRETNYLQSVISGLHRTAGLYTVHGQALKPSSQGWRTLLRNHAPEIAAMDLFMVPTVEFSLLRTLVKVRVDRRALIWINVTRNPTAD